MSAIKVLINIDLSISDESILKELILLLENFFPENLRKGLLKRYSFQCSEYDIDRNIYATSIPQWKQLLLSQTTSSFFFQINNHSFYFDCLKYNCNLSINLSLYEKQYKTFESTLYTLMKTITVASAAPYHIKKDNTLDISIFAKKQYEHFFLNNLSIHNFLTITSTQINANSLPANFA